MPYTHYDRLSAVDATFLEIEDHDVHMHVGAIAVFEGDQLRTSQGSIDIDRIRAYVDGALHDAPRFRQKLAYVPVLNHPVWVDDPRFNLRYHVRHTALPAPGSDRQLKRLAARVMSQKLDRGKPMWEMWVVEGLANGRFALVVKAHHCMVDGIAGIDLLAAILRLEPDAAISQTQQRWVLRNPPTGRRMLFDEVVRRATLPLGAAMAAPRALLRPDKCIQSLRESAGAVAETVMAGLSPTSDTPLNPEIGPYRRFDWTQTDIAAVKTVRNQFGGKLNDVVLSVTGGAVRQFLVRRGIRVTKDMVFRVMVPVSIRQLDQKGEPGNHVVNFLARLPIHIDDPVERLGETTVMTSKLKDSRLVRGAEIIEEVSDRTFTSVIVQFVRLAAQTRAYNLVVTNVPGPPVPIYFMGTRMTEIYPLVPLFKRQGLGIALFSYAGRLCWGFNADWEAFPDLHEFVKAIDGEFETLLDRADRSTMASRSRAERHAPAAPNGGGAG
jgi:diacylglycerol O-acyltransferase / wax synthase